MSIIKNADTLRTTPLRHQALAIAEAGYTAIDTDTVVRQAISLDGAVLIAGGRRFNLTDFDCIRVIGFGKASTKAVRAIESVLGEKLDGGVAIDIRPGSCAIACVEEASHPRPTQANVIASEKIVAMAEGVSERDLFIVAVSGGGSSLFCYPASECDQNARLYDDFKATSATIEEMNTVRKHISHVKGGGLATLLHPATIVGLIFCDVPGDHFEEVASGPTYLDASTIADAQSVLDRYGLTGYTLNETPKDALCFKNVVNIPVVSNTRALDAMAAHARELGFTPRILGSALYDETGVLVDKMRAQLAPKTAVIAGGEPRLVVTKKGGKGGRNQYTALQALKKGIAENEICIPFASDGRDNCDAAGGIADAETKRRADALGMSIDDALESFDTYTYFERTGDLIITGPTDSNVSDLYIYLRV